MFKGIVVQIPIIVALVLLLPMGLTAQESTAIRASARVVNSVIPETAAAAASHVAQIAETSSSITTMKRQTNSTERGIAQVTTESLPTESMGRIELIRTPADVTEADHLPQLRITIAYTAN